MARTGWLLMRAVVGVLVCATARAEAELEQQIRAMLSASRQMDYQGVLVHGMPMGVESMRFYHASGEGGYREHLVMLSGPPRELARDGTSVRRYQPDANQVVTGPQRRESGLFKLSEGDLERIRQNYHIREGPEGRVAGRQAQAIRLSARDGQRFSYRIWRDQMTDLPLQIEILDAQKQVRETFMFAVVEPGIRPRPEDLFLELPKGVAQIQRRRLPKAERPAWVKHFQLPSGFRLEGRYGGQEKGGEHLFYTDGLATLSVFLDPVVEAANAKGSACKVLQRGALHACLLRYRKFRVTLLGEVPADTLRGIAKSLGAGNE